MKKIVVSFMSLLITLLPSGQAWAWRHANRWGGSTAHTFGSTTHTGRYGGSVSHTWSGGTTAPNRFGRSATHYAGAIGRQRSVSAVPPLPELTTTHSPGHAPPRF